MATKEAHEALRAFRMSRGLSQRQAGAQFSVAHVTFRGWELGTAVPSKRFRQAIEVWTEGEVTEVSWPISDRERRLEACASAVRPAIASADSGMLPTTDEKTSTGTDD